MLPNLIRFAYFGSPASVLEDKSIWGSTVKVLEPLVASFWSPLELFVLTSKLDIFDWP